MHNNPFLPLSGPLSGNLSFPKVSASGVLEGSSFGRTVVNPQATTSSSSPSGGMGTPDVLAFAAAQG